MPDQQIISQPNIQNTTPVLENRPQEEKFFKKILKNKKILIIAGIIVLLLLIILVIIATLPKKTAVVDDTPQPVTLRLWSYSENQGHYKKILDDYKVANPLVTIQFEQRNSADYKDILEKRLKENPSTIADIFELDSKDINMYQNALAMAPTSTFSTDEFQTRFFQITQKDNILNGLLYGVPTGLDGLMLAYNTDIVKGEEIPAYWPDFAKYATSKTIINKEDNTYKQYGIAASTDSNTKYLPEIIQLLLMQNGIKNFYDDSNALSVKENTVSSDAINLYLNIVNKKPWDSAKNSIDAFADGNTGFAFIKSTDLQYIQSKNPNLKFKTKVMPIISEQIYWSSYSSYVVNGMTANSKEAWKFLNYLTSEETAKALYQTASDFQLMKKPYALKSLVDVLKQENYLAPIGVMAPNMVGWNSIDRLQFDKAVSNFIQNLSSASPEDLKSLNVQLQLIIPTYP